MTISSATYAHDLLDVLGLANVFAEATPRYPRVSLAEIAARDPEVVLLPDEPYQFAECDARDLESGALRSTAAARSGRIRVIDGTLAFWHGPRTARVLEQDGWGWLD
jgi:ABC-type Fe3+-hydroxamate transport system substrate-binding protein